MQIFSSLIKVTKKKKKITLVHQHKPELLVLPSAHGQTILLSALKEPLKSDRIWLFFSFVYSENNFFNY